jgi:hypothetical protein
MEQAKTPYRVVAPVKNKKKHKAGRMRWEQVIMWDSSLAAGSKRPFNLNIKYGIGNRN